LGLGIDRLIFERGKRDVKKDRKSWAGSQLVFLISRGRAKRAGGITNRRKKGGQMTTRIVVLSDRSKVGPYTSTINFERFEKGAHVPTLIDCLAQKLEGVEAYSTME